MDNDNKNTSGAPSSDTTSALFVSARKKQIEQQETERIAKEKEEKRLAAEAEVRRLEKEVEDRKRKAEEDAVAAEAEARRVAAEAKAKMSAAATNPDAVLGAGKPAAKPPIGINLPGANKPAAEGGAVAAKPLDTKMLMIIGGAVLAVIIIVVLIVVLAGGKKDDAEPADNVTADVAETMIDGEDISEDVTEPAAEDTVSGGSAFEGLIPGEAAAVADMGGAPEGQYFFTDDSLGLAFNYPDYWNAVARRADPTLPYNFIMLAPSGATEQTLSVSITDYTKEYNTFVDAGVLDGNQALTQFIVDFYGEENFSTDMFGEFIFHDLYKEDNGTYSYSAEWNSAQDANYFGWAYIQIDDSIGKTHAVLVTGTVDNYNFYLDDINVITESLVSYDNAVG
jgi:hypothetical protein